MSSSTVSVIAGTINPDGTVQTGSGFTASRTSTGNYTLEFPAGTFPSSLVPIAMPIANPTCTVVSSLSESSPDQSGSWQLGFADGSGNGVDAYFNFIIAS